MRPRAIQRPRERDAKAGLWRRVDEAALFQGLDALFDRGVRDLDALIAIDLAKARDQLLLARVLVEFARDEES